MKNRHFLRSLKAKTNYLYVALLIAVVLIATGIVKISSTGINLGIGGIGTTPSMPSTPSTPGTGYMRPIQFHITNDLSGADQTATSVYIYDGATRQQIGGTLTTDAYGLCHTGKSFSSGQQVIVKVVNTTGSMYENEYVVPQILQGDTYANIEVQGLRVAGTYSASSVTYAGNTTAIGNAGHYNATTGSTSGGSTTPTFVVNLVNSGADNTGLKESQDYVNNRAWDVELVVTFAGTSYETISGAGFNQQYILGSTSYGTIHLNADQLSKWKVGNVYQPGFTGAQTVSFSLDLSGYSGTGVTMTVYLYAFADPAYAQTHGGNFGSDRVNLWSNAITLQT